LNAEPESLTMPVDSAEKTDAGMAPLSDILGRMAQELRDLARTVDQLQDAVGRMTTSQLARDGETMRELQNFDRLEQALAGMADFSDSLARSASGEWRLNPHAAARAVPLGDLALRLASPRARSSISNACSNACNAGELEFF
jgi:hypothetical protein